MAEHFNTALGQNVTSGDLAIVYTIANAAGPITMISGFAASVSFLIVSYGLIAGLGLGLGMAYGATFSSFCHRGNGWGRTFP